MPIPGAALALMRDDVTVYLVDADDGAGGRSLGSGDPCKARVTRKHKMVRNKAGEMVASNIQVALAKDYPTLDVEGRVALDDGETPPIISVDRSPAPMYGMSVITVNM